MDVILFTSFQANYSTKGAEEKKEEVMDRKQIIETLKKEIDIEWLKVLNKFLNLI